MHTINICYQANNIMYFIFTIYRWFLIIWVFRSSVSKKERNIALYRVWYIASSHLQYNSLHLYMHYNRSFTIIHSQFYFPTSEGYIAIAELIGDEFLLLRTLYLDVAHEYMYSLNDIYFSNCNSIVYITFTHRQAIESKLPGAICN